MTLGKKPSSAELSARFIELADKIDLATEPLHENQIWQKRIEEIINFLPEEIAVDLIDRMKIEAGNKFADAAKFSKLYGLTPAEEKLLVNLSKGITVPEHAKNLGISVNTGRVHMQHILDKTGANGQLDLMKMLHKG